MERRKTKDGAPLKTTAPSSAFSASCACDSRRKAAPAATPARGVRITEGEARSLHGADVVDGDAREILRAEAVHEHADAVHGEHHIVVQGALFDVEAVLEPRAPARKHTHAEPGDFDGYL